MGMFDWLFQTEKKHAKYLTKDCDLPEPTRVAPPMPACKPPKGSDISEPVIKLLAMLEEDVWEPLKCSTQKESGCTSVTFGARHIFKEDLSLKVKKMWCSESVFEPRYHICTVYDHDWMTQDEREAVVEKIQLRLTEICDLNRSAINERNRELYKQFLDTV